MLGAKTNEQYKAFQNEIAYAEAKHGKPKIRFSICMEQSEALEKNVKAAESSLKEEQQHVEREKTVARERTGVDRNELAANQNDRKAVVARTDANFLHRIRAHSEKDEEHADRRRDRRPLQRLPDFFATAIFPGLTSRR